MFWTHFEKNLTLYCKYESLQHIMQMCVVGVSFSGFTIHVYELVYNVVLEL